MQQSWLIRDFTDSFDAVQLISLPCSDVFYCEDIQLSICCRFLRLWFKWKNDFFSFICFPTFEIILMNEKLFLWWQEKKKGKQNVKYGLWATMKIQMCILLTVVKLLVIILRKVYTTYMIKDVKIGYQNKHTSTNYIQLQADTKMDFKKFHWIHNKAMDFNDLDINKKWWESFNIIEFYSLLVLGRDSWEKVSQVLNWYCPWS